MPSSSQCRARNLSINEVHEQNRGSFNFTIIKFVEKTFSKTLKNLENFGDRLKELSLKFSGIRNFDFGSFQVRMAVVYVYVY